MNIIDLKKYLRNEIAPSSFKTIIKQEIDAYKKALKQRGKSVPVYITPLNEQEVLLSLKKDDFRKICGDYLNFKLDEYDLYYIADVISLSSSIHIEDEGVEDLFFEISDPEINGHISRDSIAQLLANI